MSFRLIAACTFTCVAACSLLVGTDGLSSGTDGGLGEAGTGADAGPSPPTGNRDADADAEADSAPASCTPTSVGPRFGSAAVGLGWTNDVGILVPDNEFAGASSDAPITVTGFGFALPPQAKLTGIKVEFGRTTTGSITDDAIALPKGTSKANGAWPEGPAAGPYVIATYGGPTDTWGATWTAADINAQSFGVSVSVIGPGSGHADSLGVTVYFCP